MADPLCSPASLRYVGLFWRICRAFFGGYVVRCILRVCRVLLADISGSFRKINVFGFLIINSSVAIFVIKFSHKSALQLWHVVN